MIADNGVYAEYARLTQFADKLSAPEVDEMLIAIAEGGGDHDSPGTQTSSRTAQCRMDDVDAYNGVYAEYDRLTQCANKLSAPEVNEVVIAIAGVANAGAERIAKEDIGTTKTHVLVRICVLLSSREDG